MQNSDNDIMGVDAACLGCNAAPCWLTCPLAISQSKPFRVITEILK